MAFFNRSQPTTSKFFTCDLSTNRAFTDSIEIAIKFGIRHLCNFLRTLHGPVSFRLRKQALLLQVLNALLSEGQEKTFDGTPFHCGSQFHAIEQVFRHITDIECSHVFG